MNKGPKTPSPSGASDGKASLALLVVAGAGVLAAVVAVLNASRLPQLPGPLYFAVLFAVVLVLVGFFTLLVRARIRSDNTGGFAPLITALNAQTDIARSFVNALAADPAVRKNGALKDRLEEIRTRFDGLAKSLSGLEKLPAARVTELSRSLQSAKAEMVRLADGFAAEFAGATESRQATYASMAALIYHLAVSTPILADFTSIFREFSKDMILEVINKFSDITSSSHRIADDIERSMSALMDELKEDSLAYIIRKAHDLVIDFESFYQNMDNLRNVSDNFTEKSAEKLRTIQDIADSIEQIAETIKVLSLNVSIEAANAGTGGRGFQVLARDLRAFTTKTMRFAHDVKARVKDALSTTDSLKSNYQQSMGVVYKYMEDIKGSISSFETIIQSTFDKIKAIIENIRRFSQHIDTGIQEVVGKLQYYDITSQEVEHLRLFFEKIFLETYQARSLPADVDAVIAAPDKAEIRKTVLRIIGDIVTTDNERKILRKYEESFGVSVEEAEGLRPGARSETDKNIILF